MAEQITFDVALTGDAAEDTARILAMLTETIVKTSHYIRLTPLQILRSIWATRSKVDGDRIEDNMTQIHMLMDDLAEQYGWAPELMLEKLQTVRRILREEVESHANPGQIPQ